MYFLYSIGCMILFSTQFLGAMDCPSPDFGNFNRHKSWTQGMRVTASHSDMQLIQAMEDCFVNHADVTTSKHFYNQLLPMLLRVEWTNQRERSWLVEYANAGSIPCLYHAINLQSRELERYRSVDSSAILALQSHILYFFILLEVCLELYCMTHAGDDKRWIYRQVKDQFIEGFKRDCKSLGIVFMRMHKDGKESFDHAIDVACSKVCNSDVLEFIDWVDAYRNTDGLRMIFAEEPIEPSSVYNSELLRPLADASALSLKGSYESMYRFIENKKSDFTDEAYVGRVRALTPPPQGITVKA